MREASLPSKPSTVLAFGRAGRTGVVRVRYGRTRAPRDSGFGALKGWERSTRAGVGFPTIKCEVESRRPGYWNALGWIQWVTQEFPGQKNDVRLVDRFPAFLDLDLPFAAAGYAPTFFDAPAFNSLPAVDWHATLFLCTVPAMSRKEAILPLVGMTWGYHIDRPGERPRSYPLAVATLADWRATRRELVLRHPTWKFATGFRVSKLLDSRGAGRRPPKRT